MFALITMPEPNVVLEQSSSWGNAFFAEWWAIAVVGIGIVFAFMAIAWIISMFKNGMNSFFTKNNEDPNSARTRYEKWVEREKERGYSKYK
ncbi:hypothetical protein [Nocardia mangyaensis]|uniref:hypothetical protein n=1 Tax=Nocardia mangyaensis TaxID=2213200 RepID=UPI002676DA03|nr:hypothetical protein [Nocardia mangyaensis]MDO3651282.1 hypothetical protein [Nocardia mangyaensis]